MDHTNIGIGRVTVIGMSGKARSGKNYLAYHALVPLGYIPLSLAMPFKADALARFGLPIEEVLGEAGKSDETRHRLQQMGTEEGRNVYGEDIWIDTLTAWMRWFYDNSFRNFVITDVRFPNEAQWVQNWHGGRLVRVVGRGEAENAQAKEHISETALDEWLEWDLVLDNSKDGYEPVKLLKHLGGLWRT